MRVVVIAASAGGLEPLRLIVAELPVPCRATVFIVWHVGEHRSVLPDILNRDTQIDVLFANDGDLIQPRRIYVAPPDRHMLVEGQRIVLSDGPKVHYTRPAADPTFMSVARAYGRGVMGVVLSGGNGDGAAGLKTIIGHGGTALVQHPDEAELSSMPKAALAAATPEALPVAEIAMRARAFCDTGNE